MRSKRKKPGGKIAYYSVIHGLRTPSEGINQRNLKIWADAADKICFGRTKKFGIGIEFLATSSLGVRSPCVHLNSILA